LSERKKKQIEIVFFLSKFHFFCFLFFFFFFSKKYREWKIRSVHKPESLGFPPLTKLEFINFSPDFRLLAIASSDGHVLFFDATGRGGVNYDRSHQSIPLRTTLTSVSGPHSVPPLSLPADDSDEDIENSVTHTANFDDDLITPLHTPRRARRWASQQNPDRNGNVQLDLSPHFLKQRKETQSSTVPASRQVLSPSKLKSLSLLARSPLPQAAPVLPPEGAPHLSRGCLRGLALPLSPRSSLSPRSPRLLSARTSGSLPTSPRLLRLSRLSGSGSGSGSGSVPPAASRQDIFLTNSVNKE
jgi:hypothetical protein